MEAIFSLPLADDLSFPPTGTAQAPVEPLGETDFSRVLSWAFGEKTEDRTSSGDEVPENLDGFTLAGLQTVSASGAPLYGLQGGENSSGYGLLEREGESMPMAIGDGQGKGAPGVRKDTLPDPFPGEPSMSTGPLAAPPLYRSRLNPGRIQGIHPFLRKRVSTPQRPRDFNRSRIPQPGPGPG